MNIKESISTSFIWTFRLLSLAYYTLAFYGLIIIIGWIFDDNPVVNLPPGSIDTAKTYPGDLVVFKQPIQKFRDCPGVVDRFIYGDCGILHIPRVNATLEVGSHVITIPVEIPLSFQPGSCQFVSKFNYFCDPLDYIFSRKSYSSFPIMFTLGNKP